MTGYIFANSELRHLRRDVFDSHGFRVTSFMRSKLFAAPGIADSLLATIVKLQLQPVDFVALYIGNDDLQFCTANEVAYLILNAVEVILRDLQLCKRVFIVNLVEKGPGFGKRDELAYCLPSLFASSNIAPYVNLVSFPVNRFGLKSPLFTEQDVLHPVVADAVGLTLVAALEKQYRLEFAGPESSRDFCHHCRRLVGEVVFGHTTEQHPLRYVTNTHHSGRFAGRPKDCNRYDDTARFQVFKEGGKRQVVFMPRRRDARGDSRKRPMKARRDEPMGRERADSVLRELAVQLDAQNACKDVKPDLRLLRL